MGYVRHVITKMNMNLGFGMHIPGIGRRPVMAYEQVRHTKMLGTALEEAIERDFAAPHRSIASRSITAVIITELADAHLRACIMYQNELAMALQIANREGEDARQHERKRIWGYS